MTGSRIDFPPGQKFDVRKIFRFAKYTGVRFMKIGRQEHRSSAISTSSADTIVVRGKDLPARKLLGKFATPRPLAGIAISPDGRTIVTVDDAEPSLFLIDSASGRVTGELRLEGVPKPAQIARYSPDNSLLCVTSVHSGTVSLIDPSFRHQTAIKVGEQAMDMAFRGDELFVTCQGDGSVHVIDIPARRWKQSFQAGTGCESLGFF